MKRNLKIAALAAIAAANPEGFNFDRAKAIAEREGQIAFFSLDEMKEYRIK